MYCIELYPKYVNFAAKATNGFFSKTNGILRALMWNGFTFFYTNMWNGFIFFYTNMWNGFTFFYTNTYVEWLYLFLH